MEPSTENKPAPIIFGDESLSDLTFVVGLQEFKVHKLVEFFTTYFYFQSICT